MCMMSTPSIPATPPPPAVQPTPQQPDSGVQNASGNARDKATAAMGANQTILTGAQGLQTQADTTNKTLLGQ